MIINYTAKYSAADMNDAVAQATKRWQSLISDDKAELPWGATITIHDENGVKAVEFNVSTDHTRHS